MFNARADIHSFSFPRIGCALLFYTHTQTRIYIKIFPSSFGMEDNKNGTLSSPSLWRSQRATSHPLVGFSLSRKKLSKLRFEHFLHLCKRFHIDTVELSLEYFDRPSNRIPQLIIHKLEDDLASRQLIECIRRLPSNSTIFLDPFDAIAKLLDRYEQYSLLNSNQSLYIVPRFIRVNTDDNPSTIETMLRDQRITFPLLCKPIQAHGDNSHQMKIIFDVQHLADIDKPCVLQQFIDHNGILFKVFASEYDNSSCFACIGNARIDLCSFAFSRSEQLSYCSTKLHSKSSQLFMQ